MIRRIALLITIASLCSGVRCTIIGPGDPNEPWPPAYVPLDEANVFVTIRHAAGSENARVTAVVETPAGSALELIEGQELRVNDLVLTGPDDDGNYTRTLPAAESYTLAVIEPTRGVEETPVIAPDQFEITDPAEGGGASLSGFVLEWSPSADDLQVRVHLEQTVFGDTQVHDIGPFVDTGRLELTAADLAAFVQGADLELTLTKSRSERNVAGVAEGSLTVRESAVRSVAPRP